MILINNVKNITVRQHGTNVSPIFTYTTMVNTNFILYFASDDIGSMIEAVEGSLINGKHNTLFIKNSFFENYFYDRKPSNRYKYYI